MEKLYNQLCQTAEKAAKAYYEADKPIMSDAEYDGILRQMEQIEKEHPELKRSGSLTSRVGGRAVEGFRKVHHADSKVLSLKNAYNQEDLDAFCDGIDKAWEEYYYGQVHGRTVRQAPPMKYLVQPKYDGLTLLCHYVDGVLVQALTRGDGLVGEDVTANARTILDLPQLLTDERVIGKSFWARGEVLMFREDFERINRELEIDGQPPMANERNAAAGSLRQKDPKVTAKRGLHIVFYDIHGMNPFFDYIETEEDVTFFLKAIGLPSVWDHQFVVERHKTGMTIKEAIMQPYTGYKIKDLGDSITALNMAVGYFSANRNALEFRIDGAVVKANDLGLDLHVLGDAEKYPRWAIAYKFEQQEYPTTLRKVEWWVGRTGKVTPVAFFEPVQIDGTKVAFATLNNPDYIAGLGGLHEGDVISVYKAAEIIPQVSAVITPNMNSQPFETPVLCPSCGIRLERRGANMFCPNLLCRQRVVAQMSYFASKPCMDINGVGPRLLEELVSRNIISKTSDLYLLRTTDLMKIPRIKEKSAQNIVDSIQESKNRPFDRVLCSLGLTGAGSVMCRELVKRYKDINKLLDATVDDLATVKGMGKKSAKDLWDDLHDESIMQEMDQLMLAGVRMVVDEEQTATGALEGKVICITGTLTKPRTWYKDFVLSKGGAFSESLTKSVTHLVAGDGGGSKRSKAAKLGVPVITEQQLMEMAQ